MASFCFSCQQELKVLMPVGRREECSSCRQDVHVCKNCVHYDSKAYNECREPSADVVKEKDRANFCDYFELFQGQRGSSVAQEDLKAKAEALFNFGPPKNQKT